MFWQEDEDKTLPYDIPDEVIDISFNIICKQLPLDHAWELREQLHQALPWLKENKLAGIHQLFVADSNNGWMRPEEGENQVLHPSRRTRLYLRIASKDIEETKALEGKTLMIANHPLKLGKPKQKELVNTSIIFSRHLVSDENETEDDFLRRYAAEFKRITGDTITKMMSGKANIIKTPDGGVYTRHLMIADLNTDASIKIQQFGMGEERQLGCGIFLPHKGIKSLKADE
ncbi:MAG TPA: type I-MYXAN CRISPR-associated protein Cas6/Cmx6 [Leucothrix mucor]|uniref:Type I-MYXAN CRISPR-associated protein Cas6/Cmx6 n=1 Tax=Leucothrix mucor TaxID=45248 RepID=A0A7V2SZQ7_LEUMU|nr:type I-MYXAN CRISPR-associated protein Cas6/Cmx6 [Leucothrix mucor]